jgi:hypothetical protein
MILLATSWAGTPIRALVSTSPRIFQTRCSVHCALFHAITGGTEQLDSDARSRARYHDKHCRLLRLSRHLEVVKLKFWILPRLCKWSLEVYSAQHLTQQPSLYLRLRAQLQLF